MERRDSLWQRSHIRSFMIYHERTISTNEDYSFNWYSSRILSSSAWTENTSHIEGTYVYDTLKIDLLPCFKCHLLGQKYTQNTLGLNPLQILKGYSGTIYFIFKACSKEMFKLQTSIFLETIKERGTMLSKEMSNTIMNERIELLISGNRLDANDFWGNIWFLAVCMWMLRYPWHQNAIRWSVIALCFPKFQQMQRVISWVPEYFAIDTKNLISENYRRTVSWRFPGASFLPVISPSLTQWGWDKMVIIL